MKTDADAKLGERAKRFGIPVQDTKAGKAGKAASIKAGKKKLSPEEQVCVCVYVVCACVCECVFMYVCVSVRV